MQRAVRVLLAAVMTMAGAATARGQDLAVEDPVLQRMWTLGMDSSRTWDLAQTLLDSVGPRLTGTPLLKRGNDWLVSMYQQGGIEARNEQYGTWRGWDRGFTHVDLIQPRVRTLEATLLAWSDGTRGRPVEGKVVLLPEAADSAALQRALPSLKGAFVLASMPELTCRAQDNIDEFGTPETVEKLEQAREEQSDAWSARMRAERARAAAAAFNAGAR